MVKLSRRANQAQKALTQNQVSCGGVLLVEREELPIRITKCGWQVFRIVKISYVYLYVLRAISSKHSNSICTDQISDLVHTAIILGVVASISQVYNEFINLSYLFGQAELNSRSIFCFVSCQARPILFVHWME